MQITPNLKRAIPFIVLCLIMIYSVIMFLTTNYASNIKHHIAGVLLLVNLVLYFVAFRFGVLLTGVILLVATLNMISFTTSTSTFRIALGAIHPPAFQPISFAIFIFFLILNLKFLDRNFMPQE